MAAHRPGAVGAAAKIRRAGAADAPDVGRLLDAFNREFDEPTPGPEVLSGRMLGLIARDDLIVLLAGEGPDAVAVLRLRPSIWTEALECYLAELYVAPRQRRRGLGRGLMMAAMEAAREAGADFMDLGTAEDDLAARALYESLGFDRTGGRPSGPVNFYYEREL